MISRTIHEITKTEGLTSEVRSALSVIIKSLNSSNLYKPALTKFLSQGNLNLSPFGSLTLCSLNNTSQPSLPVLLHKQGGNEGIQLDSMTQDWLARELAYETMLEDQMSARAPPTWPHIREADGTKAQSERIKLLRSWDFDVWQYEEEVPHLVSF